MVIILTGPLHSGKSTLLYKVAAALKEKKPVEGYVTFSIWSEGRAEAYDLVSLRDGSRLPLMGRDPRPEAERVGPFHFDSAGLRRARELIRCAAASSLLFVDEVGPLELSGGGVRRELEGALAARRAPTVLVVRETILDEALDSLGIAAGRIIDVREPGAEAMLLEWLRVLE